MTQAAPKQVPQVTPKDVLASISRLHGASAPEAAADLGVTMDALLPILAQLIARAYVRPIGRGVPIAPSGERRLDPEQLKNDPLEVTSRGFLELRS